MEPRSVGVQSGKIGIAQRRAFDRSKAGDRQPEARDFGLHIGTSRGGAVEVDKVTWDLHSGTWFGKRNSLQFRRHRAPVT
jgi:hypothetical protein